MVRTLLALTAAIVEYRPRVYPIPARDQPEPSAGEGSGVKVDVFR